MPLDPDIKSMLDMLASLGGEPMSQGTPEAARAMFRTLTVELRAPDAIVPVGGIEDVTVDGPGGTMAARIYRPEETGALPTVAFFHGGGFVIGDLDSHDNQCRRICRDVGAVVVAFDYRLAPESPWPGAVDDCLAGARWVLEHVTELGGDPARIAVAGDSAGGNLAAVVAQQLHATGTDIAAQLLIYPAVDFTPDQEVYPSRLQNAEGYFLTVEDMLWFSGHYVADADVSDPRLSPLRGDLAGLPPAVVVTAEFDPLRDEGNAYAEALRAVGVTVHSQQFPGMIHGFFDLFAMSPGADKAVGETNAALKELLA